MAVETAVAVVVAGRDEAMVGDFNMESPSISELESFPGKGRSDEDDEAEEGDEAGSCPAPVISLPMFNALNLSLARTLSDVAGRHID